MRNPPKKAGLAIKGPSWTCELGKAQFLIVLTQGQTKGLSFWEVGPGVKARLGEPPVFSQPSLPGIYLLTEGFQEQQPLS